MSAKIVGQIWDLDIPHAQAWVLMALADHADHEGNNVRPSVGLIAWKTNYSDRQVRRIMAELRECGILKVVREGVGQVKEYAICLENVPRKAARFSDNTGQNVTPDKMSPLTQLCQPTPDTAMSGRTVNEPSNTHTQRESEISQQMHDEPQSVTQSIAHPAKPDTISHSKANAVQMSDELLPISVLDTMAEVCGMDSDSLRYGLGHKLAKELPDMQRVILSRCENNKQKAIAELRRRFSPEAWAAADYDTPPVLRQLISEWFNQGKIADALAKGEKPKQRQHAPRWAQSQNTAPDVNDTQATLSEYRKQVEAARAAQASRGMN